MEEKSEWNISFRPVRQADIPVLNALRSDSCVARTIHSITTETEEQTRCYFFDQQELKYTIVPEAEHNGKMEAVGYVRLQLDAEQRKRHVGKLSIAVAPAFQGKGLGGKLMDQIIALAENWLCLRKIALSVLAANEQAVNLYKSRGFETEGLLRMDIVVDGIPSDVYVMGKYLKPLSVAEERSDWICPSAI